MLLYIVAKFKIVKSKLQMMNNKKIFWFRNYKKNKINYKY